MSKLRKTELEKDWTSIRERYLRDELLVRLGGLAANLARIKSRSQNVANRALIASLIEESQFFIEWTTPDADASAAAELSKLRVQLQEWQQMSSLWEDPKQRLSIAEQCRVWSERLLDMSGLLLTE